MCFVCCFFLLSFQKSSSFCRENEIFENKNQNKTKKLDQFLTYKKGNLGPVFNFTAYIYIYIHSICCEVIFWAKFGHFRCYYLGQVGVIIWAKLILAYKNSGFKRFLAHTVIILCVFFVPNYLAVI